MSGSLLGWATKLAWRDARSSGRRLLLYVSTIVVGVAALVAIRSFAINLAAAVQGEAKVLLGADLEIYGRRPFGPQAEELFERIGGEQARQVSFGSMAYFPRSGSSRLVRVRAVAGGFPFYGQLETQPAEAAERYQAERSALVDHTVMLQFDVQVGDQVRIGEVTFRIAGRLMRIPGEVPTASLIGPRVFIPLQALAATGLDQPGARMTRTVYFRLSRSPDEVAEQVGDLGPELRRLRLEAESVQYRQAVVGDALENLSRFLYLAGFAALLLGAVGVASSVHVYAKSKVKTVAVLRCLGASPRAPVVAFVLQSAVMGMVGAVTGALLGVGIQATIPAVLAAFLPVQVEFSVSPLAVVEGLLTGLSVALLFAALPLVTLRRVTPLLALRMFVDPRARTRRDPVSWALVAAAIVGLTLIASYRSGSLRLGLGLVGGLGAGLVALGATGLMLRWTARRYLPDAWPYTWRQGVANLYRPRNQTLVVMLSLGFGAFVLATLFLVQTALLDAVDKIGIQSGANLVLFDVQPDQLEPVLGLLEVAGLPVLQQTPVVPMRLASVKGRAVAELDDEEISAWVLRREYNSTYRAELTDSEEVVAGVWEGRITVAVPATGGTPPVPVSLEESIAERLGVEVGDEIEFDVQGVVVSTRVASLRHVDWQQVSPNFFVVFPVGVLEPAPQQIVVVSRADTPAASADIQRQIVERFSNVSVMDLAVVLGTVKQVLGRVSLAVRFMASFSLLAGLAVLVVSVLGSRYQRLRESVLLRTLGASRAQILQISAVEYLVLGSLAAMTGLLLAVAGAWALTRFVFDTPLIVAGPALPAIFIAVTGLTVAIGMAGSRGVTTRPPLEVLRTES